MTLSFIQFASSPRTRGYFRHGQGGSLNQPLFPAHAGVFPRWLRSGQRGVPLPRARGGISSFALFLSSSQYSSPRTRGYFLTPCRLSPRQWLFPAHAGVFPTVSQRLYARHSLPRARGGISGIIRELCAPGVSSPRTRGYFRCPVLVPIVLKLFPAHAGVFP